MTPPSKNMALLAVHRKNVIGKYIGKEPFDYAVNSRYGLIEPIGIRDRNSDYVISAAPLNRLSCIGSLNCNLQLDNIFEAGVTASFTDIISLEQQFSKGKI
jgi:hypothetical protein